MLADLEVIQTVNWRGSARFEREMLTYLGVRIVMGGLWLRRLLGKRKGRMVDEELRLFGCQNQRCGFRPAAQLGKGAKPAERT
jgi:hypothetical protein